MGGRDHCIHALQKAAAELKDVKLLVFGNVAEDVREQFDALVKQENILYVGWIESDQVYRYFMPLISFSSRGSIPFCGSRPVPARRPVSLKNGKAWTT